MATRVHSKWSSWIATLSFCIACLASARPCEAARHHRDKPAAHKKARPHKGKSKAAAPGGEVTGGAHDDLDTDASLDTSGSTAPAPAVPRAGSDAAPAEEPAEEVSAEDQPTESVEAAPNEDASRVLVSFTVSGGTTYRLIEVPAIDGVRRLDTGWVPAVGLEVRTSFRGERLRLDVAAHYQTSLHTFGSQHTTDPTSQVLTLPIRSHRFEAGFAPGLQFGAGDGALAAGVFVGYGVRALGSVAELQVPRFTEHGPLVRLEVDIPIAGETVRLRIAPEASAILSVTEEVQRLAATDALGFTFGGEATLNGRLATWLHLALSYRESHVMLHAARTSSFKDVERYVLLGAELEI